MRRDLMQPGLQHALLIFLILESLLYAAWGEAKAGFLRDTLFEPTSYSDYQNLESNVGTFYVDYDADVKIPGRHFPKLPYRRPYREDPINRGPHIIPSINHTKRGDVLTHKMSQYFLEELPQGDASDPPPDGPYFDRSLPRNLTVQTGKTAVLSCRVLNRDEKTVSWIRLHDLHILTVDKYKYSTDQRVSVVYNEVNKEWVLRILGINHSDEGRYECQVSTKPVLSYIVNLYVVDELALQEPSTSPPPKLNDQNSKIELEVAVPRAQIINSPDIYVHRGSLINLTCVVNHGTDQPVFIYWHHYNQIVDLEDKRRNVDMSTEERGRTVSQLLVQKASVEDSGKYTCKPSNGDSATVTLHILNGELQQAAMQTNSAKSLELRILYLAFASIAIVCLILYARCPG